MRKFLSIFLISMLPSVAYAACDPEDIVGRYQGYGISTEGGESEIARCRVVVQSNGVLKKGTACEVVSPGGISDKSFSISGGEFSVNAICRVEGFLIIDLGNGETSRSDIKHATMSRDRHTIVGILIDDDGSVSQLTAIRK